MTNAEKYRALFCSSDTGASDGDLLIGAVNAEASKQSPIGPLLAVGAVGAALLWAVANERKRRSARA